MLMRAELSQSSVLLVFQTVSRVGRFENNAFKELEPKVRIRRRTSNLVPAFFTGEVVFFVLEEHVECGEAAVHSGNVLL